MSDLFPHVYLERRAGRGWRPATSGRGAAALACSHDLRDDAWWTLMALTDAMCPDGADFSAAHEREFARWSKGERARLASEGCPVDDDFIFGASALERDEIQALATDAVPDLLLAACAERQADPPDPEVWAALAGELRRWLALLEARGAGRVVLWYGAG